MTLKWLMVGMFPEVMQWAQDSVSPPLKYAFSFKGQIPHKQVKRYLLQCKVGINYHPLEKQFINAIPVKVYEYMLCKLPVVTSPLPLIRQVIQNDKTGYWIKENTVKKFAESIFHLFSNPEKIKKLGENARRLVLEKYCWEKEEPKLISFYNKILGQ